MLTGKYRETSRKGTLEVGIAGAMYIWSKYGSENVVKFGKKKIDEEKNNFSSRLLLKF